MDDIVLAEASAWLARLQGPGRTPAAEAAFKAWLAMEPAHAQAFARVTEAWEIVPGAARLMAPAGRLEAAANRPAPRRARRRMPVALAACAALVTAAAGVAWWVSQEPVYRTAVGEQRIIILDDGSRVALNTDSRLSVAYGDRERRVLLERGEALFEVARQPQRPFVVQAGDQQVRALGTTFVVRRDAGQLAVSLIEGKVEVVPRMPVRQARMPQTQIRVTTLSPGERIIVRANTSRRVDRPKIEAITAWRQGEVMFDDTVLADAIAEFDRYGRTRVHLADPALGQLRVSGVFATRDPAEFVRSVAQLHGLRVDHDADGVVLRR